MIKPRIKPDESGGYSYQFVENPPEIVKCVIFHLPSRSPYLSECCGHILCRSCLRQCRTTPHASHACPMCKDSRFKTVLNKQIDREVRSLQVYCTNKEKGCTWQGEINEISGHLEKSNGCQYEDVKCSLKCNRTMQRQHLAGHMKNRCLRRKVNCQYCHDTGEYQLIEGQHKKECPKLPLPCPNKCEVESIPRENMEAHRKECPLEMIQCEYHSVGCNVRTPRKRKRNHLEENMEEHLQMTTLKLSTTEDELLSTKTRINDLEKMVKQLVRNSTGSGTVMIATDWTSHLETLANSSDVTCPVIIKLSGSVVLMDNKWYSDPFYTRENGYQMCLCVTTNDDEGLSVWLHLMKGPHDDMLPWPLKGKLEVKILNQINDSEHFSGMVRYDDRTDDRISGRITDGRMAKRHGFSEFISFQDLSETTETCQFVKDNCIFFQVRSYSI